MGTYTSRGNFYKPAADGSENVNVVTDLNNNWDKLDALLGWRPVTSGTMPASAYQGAGVYQTDTAKFYINTSSGASAVWLQALAGSAAYDMDVNVGSANVLRLANTTDMSLSSTGHAFQIGSSSGVNMRMDGNEVASINNGAASSLHLNPDGGDVTINNNVGSASSTFTVKQNASITGNLTVSGSANLDDTIVGGNLIVNGATPRPQLHSLATAANTASETAIATLNIPAGDAVVGAVYRIRVYGTAAVTGTPTITLRCRIGGVAGATLVAHPSVTVRSGMTDGYWDAECMVTCASTGASGTWAPMMKYTHNFTSTVSTYLTPGPITGAPVTRDTTISNDFVLTAQWSAASPSNTISCRGGEIRRVA